MESVGEAACETLLALLGEPPTGGESGEAAGREGSGAGREGSGTDGAAEAGGEGGSGAAARLRPEPLGAVDELIVELQRLHGL